MIKFEYSQTNYTELIKHYAKAFGVSVKDNAVALPPEIGEGAIRAIILSNGVQLFISDYKLKQDLFITRKKNHKDFYLLRFEEVTISADENPFSKSGVFLSNINHEHLFLQTAGTHVKIFSLLFPKNRMREFFVNAEGETLIKYLDANMGNFIYEPMDAEYRRLVNEALNTEIDKRFEQFILKNRGMLLVERFFTRQFLKMNNAHFSLKISGEDIASLKKVESELLKDFSEAPDINKLSRMAAMSTSKLKTSFKLMFGMPVYQYFQKHRMNKAKAMLLSRKYSVREVGEELGFSNAGNFSKAFHKSFEQFPVDILN